MNRSLASLALLATLTACPGPDPGSDNPERVFIALQGGSERRLQLVAFEPQPF
jgi:hypothetical protein